MKEWFVFKHNGRELMRMTVSGYVVGEIKSTLELLSYEKNIPIEEITVSIESDKKYGHSILKGRANNED